MLVTDGVYQVDGVLGSPTLLVGDEGIVLVDAGVTGSEEEIFALVESLGRRPGEIGHVLVTHSDSDHVGGLAAVVEATGATVYAQAIEAEVLEGRRRSRGGQLVEPPVRVGRIVADGDTLPLHGGIRVVETFGHTIGHVSYYLPARRILVSGDCLNNRDVLMGSMPQYTFDAEQARESVRKLAALEPDTICFGHGPPIVGGAAARLRALAESA